MAKTYTFPNQEIPAGTLAIELKTSSGSGTQVLTEKYFSSEIQIVNETEFEGGDLQSSYCDLMVENDVDSLFVGTIIQCIKDGGYVTVKLELEGTVVFIGNIEPSTIKTETYYAANDVLDSALVQVKFRCIWVLDLLKNVSTDELYNEINGNKETYGVVTLGRADGSVTESLNSTLRFVSLSNILKAIFSVLNTYYGFSVSYTVSNAVGILFGKDSSGSANATYVYPYLNVSTGYATKGNTRGQVNFLQSCVVFQNSAGTRTALWDSTQTRYIPNLYEWLIGIIGSTNTYPLVRYGGSYTLIFEFSPRSGGADKTNFVEQVLSAEDLVFAELSRDQIEIGSKISGNAYSKILRTRTNNKKYSSDIYFDFGGADFTGNNHEGDGASAFGLMIPVSGFWQVAFMPRALAIGENLITNPNFADMTGWTTSGFTATTADFNGTTLACATASPTGSDYLQKEFTGGLNFIDHLIAHLWIKGNTGNTVTIVFNWYGIGILGETLLFSETLSSTFSIGEPLLFYSQYISGVNRNYSTSLLNPDVSKVKIEITQNNSNAIYVTNTGLYRLRRTTPELVGMSIEDNFGGLTLTRKRRTLDGIRADIALKDYMIVGSTKYYFKKAAYDLMNNETEIEAINYPY